MELTTLKSLQTVFLVTICLSSSLDFFVSSDLVDLIRVLSNKTSSIPLAFIMQF